MKQAVWNFIVNLLILISDGVFISLAAMNGWWWAMGLAIIFVPHNATELNYSYTSLLEEILIQLRGEENQDNK